MNQLNGEGSQRID